MENLQQSETPAETSIDMVRSHEAFLRELPALLADSKYDRWCVAYRGEERIAMAKSHGELLRDCQRRGLKLDGCYLAIITPQHFEEEEIESGLSFVEFDDDEGTFSGFPFREPDKNQP